jgi:hypothetical protein
MIALLGCIENDVKDPPPEWVDLGAGDADTDTDTDADSDADTDTDTDTDADTDTDIELDGDGDGYTPSDGDCDDTDAAINPGVRSDTCDGVDNDCDGFTDEDFDGDAWEPNDVEAADLGDLADYDDETVTLSGYIAPAYDVDVFTFTIADGWLDWFNIEVNLTDVPSTADLVVDLIWVEDSDGSSHGTVDTADDEGLGGDESLSWGGGIEGTWTDTSGTYEVVVYSVEGHGCTTPYRLEISETGLWLDAGE